MLVSLLVSVWLSFVCDTPHKLYFQQSHRSRLTTHRFYWGQRHPIPRKAAGAFYPMDVLSPKKCDDRGFPLFSLRRRHDPMKMEVFHLGPRPVSMEGTRVSWSSWNFSVPLLDEIQRYPMDFFQTPVQGEMSHIFQGEKTQKSIGVAKIHNKAFS